MTDNKFPEELKTFETRLLFIRYLFDNCFEQKDILAHCVLHKLDRSLELYNDELNESLKKVTKNDPLKILNKIK